MANESFFTAGGTYDAQEFRRLLKTFYHTDPTNTGAVISGLAVVTPSSGNVKVQTGAAFVLDSGGGAYIGATQADSANIAIPSASGSARTDTIYAIIQDPGSGPTAGEMAFGRASGTSTIPSLSIPLAYVTANLDGTLTIIDARIQVELAAAHAADSGEYALTPLNGYAIRPGFTFGPTVRRLASKEIHLRADLALPGPGSTIMCVLPTLYWPKYTRQFTVAGAQSSLGNFPTMVVQVNGDLDSGSPGTVYVTPSSGATLTSFSVSWPGA